MKLYPRTLSQFILLGFLLVVLPLAVAVGYALLQFENFATTTAVAVDRGTAAARLGRLLTETLTGMERNIRQYLVVPEAALLENYGLRRAELRQQLREFSGLLLPSQQAGLQEVFLREERLHERLRQQGPRPDRELLAHLNGLEQAMEDLIGVARANVEHDVAALQASAQRERDRLMGLLPAAVPIAVLIAWLFRSLVARQVGRIEAGIRELGRGDYTHPIVVGGPSDLAALGRQLDWLRQRLAELENRQGQFMRHVSHDLKTPLTAIREGVQLLGDNVPGPLTERQNRVVTIIRGNVVRLQALIEALINYQKASQALAGLDLQPIELNAVCARVIAENRLGAAAREVWLQADLPKVPILGDGEKLRVVVDNLVTNALKFSPKGGRVRIALSCNDDIAVVDVTDEGQGIAPHERGRVFEPFFRGTRLSGPKVEGSGLGLAIAQEYVTAHGGKIELVDREEGGAHFRVTLPRTVNRELA